MINQERSKGSDILYPAIIYFYMDMWPTGRDRRCGFDDKRRIFFIIFPFVNFTLSFLTSFSPSHFEQQKKLKVPKRRNNFIWIQDKGNGGKGKENLGYRLPAEEDSGDVEATHKGPLTEKL